MYWRKHFPSEAGNNVMTQQRRAIIAVAVSTAAILSVNALFAFKYLPRWLPHPLIFITGYLIAFTAFQFFCARSSCSFSTRKRIWLITAAMAVFWIVAFRYIAVEYLRVDRWLMATGWLDNFFSGQHPYTPLSAENNVPGPFPVLFLLAIPFYWLHEIGYFSIAGFLFLAFLLVRIFKDMPGAVMFCLMSLFFSLPFQWEVFTRSTLFVNAVLMVGVAHYYYQCKWTNRHQLLIGGLMGGLLLSTRSIAVIPFAVSLIMVLRTKPLGRNRSFFLLAITAVVFILTLLPLYLWHPAEFCRYNPILVQNLVLPAWWLGGIFLLCACVAGWFSRTFFAGIAWSGILLFLIVMCSFIMTIFRLDFTRAFFESRFDISYFIISLPLLIIAQQQAILMVRMQKNGKHANDPVVF